ncbi:hypothetical protein [Membranihabitans marinus]|uniref:hypothetical protein n=1 Tax=Membranihabitans marinus TaxID=1227546 RepID=UPI001F1D3DDD|nr:hypothetical protein [Membranihabitans marinus]
MNKISILTTIVTCIVLSAQAQIKLDAVLGGGTTYLEQYYDASNKVRTKPDYSINAGFKAATKFRKDGMLGIELGALISYTGFKNIPQLKTQDGNLVFDEDNPISVRSLYLKVPLTLDFNVYERFGLLLGGHLNLRLSKKEEFQALITAQDHSGIDSKFRKITPGIHLGFYGKVNDRIRIDGQVFSDVLPRLQNDKFVDKLYFMELGFSINCQYRLNP